MKRLMSLFLFLACLMALAPLYAATQNLNSYYPAPQGDYKDIIVNNLFTLTSPGTPCASNGTNVYLSNNNGQLYVCDQFGQYFISGDDLWTGNGTFMYPTVFAQNVTIGSNTASVANLDVTPGFMHVAGTSSAGTAYPSQGAYLNWNTTVGTGETDFINNQGGGTGGFRFFNVPAPGSGTPTAIITGGGNVILGVNTANSHIFNGTTTIQGSGAGNVNLTVNGRIQTGDLGNSGGVWLDNPGNIFVGQNGTAAGFWNSTSGWSMMVVPGGNVGIGPGNPAGTGDTTPGALLEVESSVATTFNTTGATAPSIMVCTNNARTNCGYFAVTQDATDNNFYAVYSP